MNRDLDAKICKDIFGWKLTSVGPDADGQNACEILTRTGILPEEYLLPNKGKLHEGYLTPLYSVDLRLAISLAKMVGLELTIQMMPADPEALAQMSYDYFMKTGDDSKGKTRETRLNKAWHYLIKDGPDITSLKTGDCFRAHKVLYALQIAAGDYE